MSNLVDEKVAVKRVATDSMLRTFRTCRRKYLLRYVRQLAPVKVAVPLSWGSLAHEMLAALYRMDEGMSLDSTSRDLVTMASDWVEAMGTNARESMARAEFAEFLEGNLEAETVKEAEEIASQVLRVVETYAAEHWLADRERYEFPFVEQTFTVPLPDARDRRHGVWCYRGRWDLVARDRTTGRFEMFDHKFTSREPEALASELDTDTQPVAYMYAAQVLATLPPHLRRIYDEPEWPILGRVPDGFVHNIVRRKAPEEPPLLKNRKKPTLSQARSLLTTERMYLRAITRHGLDPAEYADTLERLRKAPPPFSLRRRPGIGMREVEAWLDDVKTTLRDIGAVDLDHSKAYRNPDACRAIARRCPYIPLCWGDPEGAMHYFRREAAHVELLEPGEEANE